MSEEGKVRISLALNSAILLSVVSGIFFLGMRYSSLTTSLDAFRESIAVITARISHIEEGYKTVEEVERELKEMHERQGAQASRMATQEEREMALEGKVQTLTEVFLHQQPTLPKTK